MKSIRKIKLQNFKRFRTFEVDFDPSMNILIGDNESGKSTILSALNLVLSGSRSKVEATGLESLFNVESIIEFMASERKYANLPVLFVEVYLNEQHDEFTYGKNNSDTIESDGLRFECVPNDALGSDIKKILEDTNAEFPFEFYNLNFFTFADQPYSGYRRLVRHVLIDNSQISSEYAVREYIKDMYNSYSDPLERSKHQYSYRQHKETYKKTTLKSINDKLGSYEFEIRDNSKSNLQTDLNLSEAGISLDNKGKGRQNFVKTEFALSKNTSQLDIILLEEPENHLSHTNVGNLVATISSANNKQLILSTHSNMVSTRLDLRKTIMLNSSSSKPVKLNSIPEPTAKFFIKAPDNNILDYILSSKVILVEGDAEFLLMEALYSNVTGKSLKESGIHVLAVGGLSFKRYMDIAKELKIKTAIIRDNDGSYQKNCVDNYSEYNEAFIKLFADTDDTRSTFEICIYGDNKAICDGLFSAGRKTLTVQEYMLQNKAEAAYCLLDQNASALITPGYIKAAIEWISA